MKNAKVGRPRIKKLKQTDFSHRKTAEVIENDKDSLPGVRFFENDSPSIIQEKLNRIINAPQSDSLSQIEDIILIHIFYFKFEQERFYMKHKKNLNSLIKKAEQSKSYRAEIDLLSELYNEKIFILHRHYFTSIGYRHTKASVQFYKKMYAYYKTPVSLLVSKLMLNHKIKNSDIIFNFILKYLSVDLGIKQFRNSVAAKKSIETALKNRLKRKVSLKT